MQPLSQNSWHMRRYLWWYQEKRHYWDTPKSVNLCPYVRVVLFWYTLRQAFMDGYGKTAVSWAGVAGIVNILVYKFRGKGDTLFLDVMAIVVAIALALLIGLCLGAEWLKDYKRMKRHQKYVELRNQGIDPDQYFADLEANKGPSFGSVLWEVLSNAHKKICPILPIAEK